MTKTAHTGALSLLACEDGFGTIEGRLRVNIEIVFDKEPGSLPGRLRYGRKAGAVKDYRDGHRDHRITGTFGTETISVPRARVENEDDEDIVRLNEEFRRRIMTRTTLPGAETVLMLLGALLTSGQIPMRKVDGRRTLDTSVEPMPP
jgi:transposase-like protein